MFEHFRFCEEFNYKLNLYRLADNGTVDHLENFNYKFIDNCKFLNSSSSWTILHCLKAYYIKTKEPEINFGWKISKELQLKKTFKNLEAKKTLNTFSSLLFHLYTPYLSASVRCTPLTSLVNIFAEIFSPVNKWIMFLPRS